MDNKKKSAITGAAFLMATSAVGPGFLTQTTVFTEKLLTSFGFVILVSIILDIGAQVNIWRIITVTGKRAQSLSEELLPGLGWFLAILVGFGGLAFNIGNIAGTALGASAATGIHPITGALVSAVIALWVFWSRDSGKVMDILTKVLGVAMVLFTLYIAVIVDPPVLKAIRHSFMPERTDLMMIITLVGGTVGGYISFAGAHRLIDAGFTGKESLPMVTRSSIRGVLITSLMRFILFLAVLGVVSKGVALDPSNPPASLFKLAAGPIGERFFGFVMWCAAITSVIGASFTSVSFFKTLVPQMERYQKPAVTIFILISTIAFISIGHPVKLLVFAGAANGFILPVALTVILLVSKNSTLMKDYLHPVWMRVFGWLVVAVMGAMSLASIVKYQL